MEDEDMTGIKEEHTESEYFSEGEGCVGGCQCGDHNDEDETSEVESADGRYYKEEGLSFLESGDDRCYEEEDGVSDLGSGDDRYYKEEDGLSFLESGDNRYYEEEEEDWGMTDNSLDLSASDVSLHNDGQGRQLVKSKLDLDIDTEDPTHGNDTGDVVVKREADSHFKRKPSLEDSGWSEEEDRPQVTQPRLAIVKFYDSLDWASRWERTQRHTNVHTVVFEPTFQVTHEHIRTLASSPYEFKSSITIVHIGDGSALGSNLPIALADDLPQLKQLGILRAFNLTDSALTHLIDRCYNLTELELSAMDKYERRGLIRLQSLPAILRKDYNCAKHLRTLTLLGQDLSDYFRGSCQRLRPKIEIVS
ncbi:hypothetical protein PtrSN002B_003319 [Pyrenophora tritici-repentis]|uniref:Uncharacterized protein n=1 Tax=Pyrenophora tritici-repentis TaxID=45151 RepID=A0A2W1E790_9PLEO|nr:hypothetical protein A1F99_124370 [Pyrenophora tritici-repentis]KAG9376442.1 hypothetical protein A1F94_012989 [Pyrenophora tritici-repentis]KAI0575404.1 hypothetical protein Alg215_08035 [Pyrenophora tritici-repentis]KAI0591197.1 hypothetical protein Alg130_01502 [Pyrenophora tritici-repentis]KAI0611926.1 hypothetical protein TUN205_03853 [Pyrenophora tritici-repentis]